MTIEKILLVDDSSTELKKLEGIVTSAGYTVITATSGGDAIEKIKSEMPDVIFCDIIMEDMNGFQVCRAVKSEDATKNIPIVLVSSKNEETDKVWGEEQGATAYITKPYTDDQILDQLKAL